MKCSTLIVLTMFFLGRCNYVFAQLDSCNVFLKGKYLEVGITTNGDFGSSCAAPAGYHPRGVQGLTNYCYPPTCNPITRDYGLHPNAIAFVADPDTDGWAVGSPSYFGDYILTNNWFGPPSNPSGNPDEGWTIQIDGNDPIRAWLYYCQLCFHANTTGFLANPLSRATGGNVSYFKKGKFVNGLWKGLTDSVAVSQLTTLDTSKLFVTVTVTLTNTSHSTKRDITYDRFADARPDWNITRNLCFTDTIEYQNPNINNYALVAAEGRQYKSRSYIGLGSSDCRAKVFLCKAGLDYPTSLTFLWPYGTLDTQYFKSNNGIGDTGSFIFHQNQPRPTDTIGASMAIGIAFQIGDLAPGDSARFSYSYIFSNRQAQEALASTVTTNAKNWAVTSDSSNYYSGDTALVCPNTSVTLKPVGNYFGTWSWLGVPGSTVRYASGDSVKVPVDSNVLVVKSIIATACGPDTITMILKPQFPAKPIVTTPVNYCKGSISVQPLSASGMNLRWYTDLPGDTGKIIAPIPSTDSLGDFIYYVTQTVNKCESKKVAIDVSITPPSYNIVASNNSPLCLGDTLQLNSLIIPGAYYSWTGPLNFKSNLPQPNIVGVIAADSGIYTIKDSVAGCVRITTTTVHIDNVVAAVSLGKPNVCQGDSLRLSFSGIAPDTGSHYAWSFNNGNIISGDSLGRNIGPYTVRWSVLGLNTVSLQVKNWRCSSTVIDTINVVNAPVVSFNVKKDLCIGEPVILDVADYSLIGAESFVWNFDGADVLQTNPDNGFSKVVWNSSGDKIISLSIKYLQCSRDPYLDTVTVHPSPVASITNTSKNNICEDDSIVFTAYHADQYKYTWTPQKYFLSYADTSNVGTAVVPFSGNIYVRVQDRYNCMATDSVFITTVPCCQVYMPNSFTPNGDGRNDVFRPITIGHNKIHLQIVNRWGQIVFESFDQGQGWNGTYNNVKQEVGTYFYYLSYFCNGKTITQKGDVTLIR